MNYKPNAWVSRVHGTSTGSVHYMYWLGFQVLYLLQSRKQPKKSKAKERSSNCDLDRKKVIEKGTVIKGWRDVLKLHSWKSSSCWYKTNFTLETKILMVITMKTLVLRSRGRHVGFIWIFQQHFPILNKVLLDVYWYQFWGAKSMWSSYYVYMKRHSCKWGRPVSGSASFCEL